jgi:hypothetical protein
MLAANRKANAKEREMGKKKSRVQAAENQESTIIEEGQTMEVTNIDVETVPATIVEGLEAEVFPNQEIQIEVTPIEGQEVTTEVASVETPEVVVQAEKPPRVSKRPYIARCAELLEAGSHSNKEIVALVLVEFPEVKKGGIQTFVTDLKNEKYRHWKERAVVVNASGKLQFADKVVTVAEVEAAETTQEEQPEQLGE